MTAPSTVAVAIHDVEPRTLRRCREIRSWLAEHGIDRATLLAIPAPRGTPMRPRSSDLASWLRERCDAGDTIAQHGFLHVQVTPSRAPRQWLARLQGGAASEFVGLDADATSRALELGRELLVEAGVAPRGFVAPAYAYTTRLRRQLDTGYDWWADLTSVHTSGGVRHSPAVCLGTSTRLKRVCSRGLVQALALGANGLLRVDVHPADFDHPRSRAALERVLARARRREPVTYDEVVADPSGDGGARTAR